MHEHEPSQWGELGHEEVEGIKRNIEHAVARGVMNALESGCVKDAIAQGMQEGIRHAAEDSELCDLLVSRAATSFRRSAAKASGEIVVDGLIKLTKKVGWFFILGILVYAIGGWAGLAAVWKYMSTEK